MHVLKTSFNGNPNIGLYGFCNDEFCLMGKGLSKEKIKEIENVLSVPVHEITLCGTSLIGVFTAGNSNTILVPSIVFDCELETLDKLGIKYTVLDCKLTALGNNIICNDFGAIVNPEFTAVQKKNIRKALNVKVVPGKIAGLETVGSIAVINKKHCAIHMAASKEDQENVKTILDVKCIESTVNMGSPHIKSGLLCNKNGFIMGEQSSGPEMMNIDEELGYI